jgi:hypothetical protein
MQAAKSRHGDDSPAPTVALDCSSCRSLLRQSEMRAVAMVVADVLGHHALDVPLRGTVVYTCSLLVLGVVEDGLARTVTFDCRGLESVLPV